MDITQISQVISSVGFPIVACGALFYMINTTMKELTSVISELEKTMAKMVEKKSSKDEETEE